MNNFLIALLLLSFNFISYSQNDCREKELIVEEITEGGYFKNSRINTGLTTKTGMEVDRQFLLYLELDRCVRLENLIDLLEHTSNIVAAYAWKSILKKSPSAALRYFIKNNDNLEKRYFKEFLNHCQGTVDKSLSQFMIQEITTGIKNKSIGFSKSEINSVNKYLKSKYKIPSSTLTPRDF